MSQKLWEAIKRTSKRGIRGKLFIVFAFFFVIYAITYVFTLFFNIQNNLRIGLKDAQKLGEPDLMSVSSVMKFIFLISHPLLDITLSMTKVIRVPFHLFISSFLVDMTWFLT